MIKQRQHYVSRYYLTAWTNDKKQIFCLRDGKIFSSSLMNVAQERFFYKIQNLELKEIDFIKKIIFDIKNEKLIELHINFLRWYTGANFIKKLFPNNVDIDNEVNEIKINLEEDYHADIESIGNKYLDMLRNGNTDFYNNTDTNHRMEFLFFIVLQYFRTKKIKNSVISSFKNYQFDMEKIWPFLAHVVSVNLSYDLHLDKSMKLILLENDTNEDFLTGDQPILNTYSFLNDKELKHNELEFYYPISPKLAILISDKIKNNFIKIDDIQKVKKYNEMIINVSLEQIYSLSEEQLLKIQREIQ